MIIIYQKDKLLENNVSFYFYEFVTGKTPTIQILKQLYNNVF